MENHLLEHRLHCRSEEPLKSAVSKNCIQDLHKRLSTLGFFDVPKTKKVGSESNFFVRSTRTQMLSFFDEKYSVESDLITRENSTNQQATNSFNTKICEKGIE